MNEEQLSPVERAARRREGRPVAVFIVLGCIVGGLWLLSAVFVKREPPLRVREASPGSSATTTAGARSK